MPVSVPYVGLDLSTGACFRSMDSLLPKNPTLQAQVRSLVEPTGTANLVKSRLGVVPNP